MSSDLVEAWNMSNEANLFVIKTIPAAALKDSYAPRTRTVAQQFTHMHNVRLQWVQHAARDLLGSVKGFPRGAEANKTELKAALKASGDIVARFVERSETTGKVKSWNGSPATFLAYLIAHEGHHRGLAMVAMRMCGRELGDNVVYGQWQWGKQRKTR